jgi:hypothetical protein
VHRVLPDSLAFQVTLVVLGFLVLRDRKESLACQVCLVILAQVVLLAFRG